MASGSERGERVRARVLSELEPVSSAHGDNLSRVRHLALEDGDHGLKNLMTEYKRSASKVEAVELGLECIGALRVWEGELDHDELLFTALDGRAYVAVTVRDNSAPEFPGPKVALDSMDHVIWTAFEGGAMSATWSNERGPVYPPGGRLESCGGLGSLREDLEAHRARIEANEAEVLGVQDLMDVVAMQRNYQGQLASATMIGLSRFADVFAKRVLSFFD